MLRDLKRIVISFVPSAVLDFYHLSLAYIGAAIYHYPSSHLFVIGVTGTKGKSSTSEMLNAILEEAGHKTALLNSIRIKVDDESVPNKMRMSMPGRFFIQAFLAEARDRKCTVAILEMTSEGARQHRHRAIDLDALVFTNLAPEHIESHGSYEKYADTKFEIGKQLQRSRKRPRYIVANAEDRESTRYLSLSVEHVLPLSLASVEHTSDDRGGEIVFDDERLHIHLPGEFSLQNALSAATLTRAMGVSAQVIARALEKLEKIPGRAERIEAGQSFDVIVDYAHTPGSLRALYEAYAGKRKICVLGSTGGGRDMWKRPVMGKIADEYCDSVILTNEDPYDEDPRSIIDSLASAMPRPPEIVMDRREAIRRALEIARNTDAVLITGKGTDPSICVAHGRKIPWSDAGVAREEIEKLLKRKPV